MDYLALAIKSLTNNAEFTLIDGDYSTIEWVNFDGKAPSQAEVDAEIESIKNAILTAEADKAAARESAYAKLAQLGLTPEEVAALLV
jgi:hypothetical protein